MNKNRSEYEETILFYLEEKYDEEFVVKDLSRISSVGSADTVYALCYSQRFPNDFFEVAIHLSIYDIYNKTEIIDILSQAGVYEGEFEKEDPDEGLISDNYINVIVQNEFDDKLDVDALFVKTQITTPNKHINVSNKNIAFDEYFEKYNNDIVMYTSVFVNDIKLLNDNAFLSKNMQLIVNDKLKDQFIFYYATDLTGNEIERVFAQNYDDNNQYFYDAVSTKKYVVEKYSYGEKE